MTDTLAPSSTPLVFTQHLQPDGRMHVVCRDDLSHVTAETPEEAQTFIDSVTANYAENRRKQAVAYYEALGIADQINGPTIKGGLTIDNVQEVVELLRGMGISVGAIPGTAAEDAAAALATPTDDVLAPAVAVSTMDPTTQMAPAETVGNTALAADPVPKDSIEAVNNGVSDPSGV